MVNPSFAAAPQGDAAKLMMFEAQKKSMGVSYVLWFFLGGLGAHRFYLGRTGSAVGMLVLFFMSLLLVLVYIGLLGFLALWVWQIVDAFLIPGIVREYNMQLAHALSYTPPQPYPQQPYPQQAHPYPQQPHPYPQHSVPATAPAPAPAPQPSAASASEKLCPSCNSRNSAAGRFCNHCGTALAT